jgi:hypothetical protein
MSASLPDETHKTLKITELSAASVYVRSWKKKVYFRCVELQQWSQPGLGLQMAVFPIHPSQ